MPRFTPSLVPLSPVGSLSVANLVLFGRVSSPVGSEGLEIPEDDGSPDVIDDEAGRFCGVELLVVLLVVLDEDAWVVAGWSVLVALLVAHCEALSIAFCNLLWPFSDFASSASIRFRQDSL